MLRDNTMDWIHDGINRNLKVNHPEAMYRYEIKTLADAQRLFPGCRQGRGLTPIDKTVILREVVTVDGYRVQLIKNSLPGKKDWVQITY